MKKSVVSVTLILLVCICSAQGIKTIKLNPPDLTRGLNVMKAFSLRASASEFDTASLKLQDLSDLLWAANGINRAANGKRTAPSAMNAQDIDVYVCMRSGIYLYDAKKQELTIVAEGDYRKLVADRQDNFANAPVFLVQVSDISRFTRGEEKQKMIWGAEDAGIVSQNIGLFCSGMGMITRPRASMNDSKLREVMKVKESQHLMLNHPVSYVKK
jgi:SagB-type dehydrogenase family enzyme